MAQWLITGGAGFIGSHITHSLVKQGETARIFDNLSTGVQTNLAGVESKIEFLQKDIRDLDALHHAMEGIDYVIHLAAQSAVAATITNPTLAHDHNVTGTLNVLMAARRAGVKRVVLASSCAIYGNTPIPKITEDTLPHPMSPYALSKLISEQYAHLFFQNYGLETVSVRYFNVYGPNQRTDTAYAAVIPIFFQACLNKQPATLHGDGQQSRDFIYVSDVVHATVTAAESKTIQLGTEYNIGSGTSVSIGTLLQMIQELTGFKTQPRVSPSRAGDIRTSCADISHTQHDLGWEPVVTLKEGLKKVYESLRN